MEGGLCLLCLLCFGWHHSHFIITAKPKPFLHRTQHQMAPLCFTVHSSCKVHPTAALRRNGVVGGPSQTGRGRPLHRPLHHRPLHHPNHLPHPPLTLPTSTTYHNQFFLTRCQCHAVREGAASENYTHSKIGAQNRCHTRPQLALLTGRCGARTVLVSCVSSSPFLWPPSRHATLHTPQSGTTLFTSSQVSPFLTFSASTAARLESASHGRHLSRASRDLSFYASLTWLRSASSLAPAK